MMNKVFLVGRITRDLELRQTASGHPYVFFTVAFNRLPLPNVERLADFISCVAWNRQAENLSRFIRKGGLVGIDGKLQTRTVQNPDGSSRTVMEVVCDNVTFLEPRSNNDQQVDSNYFNQNNTRPQFNPVKTLLISSIIAFLPSSSTSGRMIYISSYFFILYTSFWSLGFSRY